MRHFLSCMFPDISHSLRNKNYLDTSNTKNITRNTYTFRCYKGKYFTFLLSWQHNVSLRLHSGEFGYLHCTLAWKRLVRWGSPTVSELNPGLGGTLFKLRKKMSTTNLSGKPEKKVRVTFNGLTSNLVWVDKLVVASYHRKWTTPPYHFLTQ